MYVLRIKDIEYTIPKKNIGMFAYIKAKDHGTSINPIDKDGAIRFLEGIGIEVEDIDK